MSDLFESDRGLLIAGQDQGRNDMRSTMKEMFSWYETSYLNVYFLLSYTLVVCLTLQLGASTSFIS